MELQANRIRSEIISMLKSNQNLLAVSKLQPAKKIKELASLGQIHFGENYVQEALVKIQELAALNLKWHLIGPLQKNKIKYLRDHFEYIHSVDSISLATRISKNANDLGIQQKIFIQVNLSQESTKSGFSEVDLLNSIAEMKKFSGIQIIGLMTMPPIENEAEKNRSYFKKLFALGRELNLSEFSMGTSQDFQVALQEGATWIRIGTVLFGDREIKEKNEEGLK